MSKIEPETTRGYSTIASAGNGKLELLAEPQCEMVTTKFNLVNGKLKYSSQNIEEIPGCEFVACFTGDSKVLTSKLESQKISNIKVGDLVLTYDILNEVYSNTEILEMKSVKHNNLVELYFNHDTITSTDDHPYFVDTKAWSSFNPRATILNYNNYNDVSNIKIGDSFILSNGNKAELLGYKFINEPKQTYTITKLENGNTFFVNKILVGVEEIQNEL